jgi:hypothetical protein
VRTEKLAPLLLLTSCLQIGPPGGADAGSRATRPTGAQDGASANTGSDCVDFGSGAVLCTNVSACQGIAVDHDLYPNCGFRVPSSSIDLECVCNNSLCPMGSALSCTQARDLLASQSEIAVCMQASEGRCAALPAHTTGQSCDRSCASSCVSDPLCLKMCGC